MLSNRRIIPLFSWMAENVARYQREMAERVAAIPDDNPLKPWALLGGSPGWMDVDPEVRFMSFMTNKYELKKPILTLKYESTSRVKHFRNLPDLEESIILDFRDFEYTLCHIRELADYPHIRGLSSFNNDRVDDVIFEAITRMAELRYLDITTTLLTASGLRHLGRLQKLRRLSPNWASRTSSTPPSVRGADWAPCGCW